MSGVAGIVASNNRPAGKDEERQKLIALRVGETSITANGAV